MSLYEIVTRKEKIIVIDTFSKKRVPRDIEEHVLLHIQYYKLKKSDKHQKK